jgi:hypothetical protein
MLFPTVGIGVGWQKVGDSPSTEVDKGIPEGILVVGSYGFYEAPFVTQPINAYTFADKDTLRYDTTRNDQYTQPIIASNQGMFDIVQLEDFSMVVAGNVFSNATAGTNRITKFNLDGSFDTTFNSGGAGFDAYSYTITKDNNNDIYVGGAFTTYNGVSANRIIKLDKDGNIDFTFNYGTGFDGFIRDIVYDDVNNLIWACGDFTSYNGTTSGNIIALNPDGSVAYNNPGTGASGPAYTMKVNSDVVFLVGGWGTWNGASVGNGIIKLDILPNLPVNGSFQTGIGTGINSGSIAYDMAYNPRTLQLVVCGSFGSFNGVPANFVVSLDMNTGANNPAWSSLGFNQTLCRTVRYVEYRDEMVFSGSFQNASGADPHMTRLQGFDATTATINTDYDINVFGNFGQEPFQFIVYNKPTP